MRLTIYNNKVCNFFSHIKMVTKCRVTHQFLKQ